MSRLPNRNAPLPQAAQPRVTDSNVQRAFDLLFVPLREVVRFLQPFVQAEKWKPLPLDASVSNYATDYARASYRKNPLGRVEVRGEITISGAHGGSHTIATLPEGYRPRLNQVFVIADTSGSSTGLVRVTPLGVVEHLAGGHTHVSMEFSFDTVNE